ncbi:MAG TPA: hypothetical protein VNB24_02810 [Acidimicrobiales bacterium]|nr:hypothetical protein [Acidimicrobiales bacterium]
MNALGSIRRMRSTTPLLALSAMFIAAGGFIHVRDWLGIYRFVPANLPGSSVVRVGFLVNAVASVVLVAALVFVVRRAPRFTYPAILAAIGFQAASLATLIGTRIGSVFGWSEPIWTSGATQTRAVEVGAIVALLALAFLFASSAPERRLVLATGDRKT